MHSEKRHSLAFVTDRYWPALGGIEQTVRSLCQNLPDHIHPEIITLNPPTNHRSLLQYYLTVKGPRTDPEGHTIHYLELSVLRKMLLLPLVLWNTRGISHFRSPALYDQLYIFFRAAFLELLKPLLCRHQIVHSFSTSYLARLATEICNVHSIPLIHTPPIHFGRWGDSPQQCTAYINGNTLTCFTEHFKQHLTTRCSPTNQMPIQVIPPFTKCYRESNATSETTIDGRFILFLGRREPHKGLQLLIDAYGHLDTDVKLVIAGPGPQYHTSTNMIIDLGEISDKTKHNLLFSCECLSVPTRDESFGIVFTEAMSYSKPVVAINIPPVNEIVRNGTTGLLIPAPGDPINLSKALQTIINDTNQRISMGVEAKKRYDQWYSPEAVLPKILSLYEHHLKN